MLKQTRYKGTTLKPGNKLTIDDGVGKRWVSVGIAEIILPEPKVVEEEEIEEEILEEIEEETLEDEGEPDGDLPTVRDRDSTSKLSGDYGISTTNKRRKTSKKSK